MQFFRFFTLLAVLFIYFSSTTICEAQWLGGKKKPETIMTDEEIAKQLPTYAIDLDARIRGLKIDKPLIYIYVDDNDEWLVGDECVMRYTGERGYMMAPQNDFAGVVAKEVSTKGVGWHNFKASFKLLFKLGPGWKSRLRRQVRQCRNSSGNFVG